ncbi:MAG: hypothetical protein WBP40_05370 [Candidatus Moraniibacteriota bacterium]
MKRVPFLMEVEGMNKPIDESGFPVTIVPVGSQVTVRPCNAAIREEQDSSLRVPDEQKAGIHGSDRVSKSDVS